MSDAAMLTYAGLRVFIALGLLFCNIVVPHPWAIPLLLRSEYVFSLFSPYLLSVEMKLGAPKFLAPISEEVYIHAKSIYIHFYANYMHRNVKWDVACDGSLLFDLGS